ncbi:MAG: hypothetical protein Kow0099_07860 [Candidatus Abyssubacteria bacterium]
MIHLGVFTALGQESLVQKVTRPPEVLLARRMEARPKPISFELVDTPASAESDTPPEHSRLMSDKNTRAQDLFEGEKKLDNSPHMEGRHEDSRDTRPRAEVIPPAPPAAKAEARPEQATPKPAMRPAKRPAEKPDAKKTEAPNGVSVEPARKEEPPEKEANPVIRPEPEERKVIQLAKKLPEAGAAGASVAPSAPHIVTTASSRNVNADAEITGELSFGASRHFFGEYLLKMKQAVERQWVSRLVSQYTGVVSSEAVIDFKIQPDGSVTDLSVAEVDGDAYFSVVCVSSITDAQPFGEIPYDAIEGLPEEYKNKALSVRFTFRYH